MPVEDQLWYMVSSQRCAIDAASRRPSSPARQSQAVSSLARGNSLSSVDANADENPDQYRERCIRTVNDGTALWT